MATAFGSATIDHAKPYWLERTPYTFLIPTLQPGQQQNIFAVTGWNPGTTASMIASILSLGITQYQDLQVTVTYDSQTDRYFAEDFPPALAQVPMGQSARRNLALSLTNVGATALTNIQGTYLCQSWKAPVAYKLLQGYAPSAQDRALALAAGLSQNPVEDDGMFPIPLDTVIERTYQNRRIRPLLRYSQPVVLAQAGVPQTFDHIQASPNELLVLTGVSGDADFDDTVTLLVDRDNDSSHVQVALDQFNLSEPLAMWVPAVQYLTFRLSAAVLPPAAVPVRTEVLRASMDLILALRMGMIDQGQVASVLSQMYTRRGVKDPTAKANKDASYLATGVAAGVR